MSLLLLVAGCTSHKPDPIPTYPPMSNADALAVVRERLAAVHTVQAQATIVLTDAQGKSVRLDGVYLLAPPDRARLRAWKFGQAVFDLTLREDGAWAVLPEGRSVPAGMRDAVARWVGLLTGSDPLYRAEGLADGKTIGVMRLASKGVGLYCVIDRATLTPRRYFLSGDGRDSDATAFGLTLSDYRIAGKGPVWPMTIRAKSNTDTIEIETSDVELNGDLPPSAFAPPARAVPLP